MLTVDFERLGLLRGERLLDMGAGGGRHAFQAMKLGAIATALDYSAADLKDVMATTGGMLALNEITDDQYGGCVNGNALDLPFPDNSFDRVITSEVLEHIWDCERAITEIVRVTRPGGRIAITVPTYWPERVNWALNWHYHDVPGGHVRIFKQRELETMFERSGVYLRGSHHAHAYHSPYWWLKNVYGIENTEAPPVKKYHDFLVHCIEHFDGPLAKAERFLNPLMGKSLVIYGEKVDPDMAKYGKKSLSFSARQDHTERRVLSGVPIPTVAASAAAPVATAKPVKQLKPASAKRAPRKQATS